MRAYSLFSGSSGNCVFVQAGKTRLLIDAGVSARRIALALDALGENPADLSAIFLTHEHADHVGGLQTLLKKTRAPVYTSVDSARALYALYATRAADQTTADAFAERVRTVLPGETYDCGELHFSPFSLPHDSAACLGLTCGDDTCEKALGVATDLGTLPPDARRALCGAQALILESNHDPELLKSGNYPEFLKERILSDCGHLSNPASAALLAAFAAAGCRGALLFHLSRENNTPALALSAARESLSAAGACEGECSFVCAAPDATVPVPNLS